MKIYKKIILLLFIALGIFLLSNTSYATETTQKLYQDITINSDGSITVKEAALLSGEYNGRLRNIEFKNYNSNKFTGIYSNFTGNTDIYDGSGITNIKIADISQKNFNTIEDIDKIEKVYTQKNNASTGDYGVYKLTTSSYGADFKVFCKSTKNKVFYMEYTINDAVVIHNDVAELYWNVMGSDYEEKIADFQVLIHLPKEDSDVRIWTHGPLTGVNSIVNKKTLSFKDTNVKPYKAETVRIMFNKDLVPNGTKKSGVNGREYILKYEASQADAANAEREKAKLEKINEASNAVIELRESPSMYAYNTALKYVMALPNTSTEKQDLLNQIYALKETVNNEWKNKIEARISYLDIEYNYYILKSEMESIESDIDEGFDEEAKTAFREQLEPFYAELTKKEREIRITTRVIVAVLYAVGFAITSSIIIKELKDRKLFEGKYYREFPSNDSPYVIEYLMKQKITNLSISATILGLIAKKVIKIEEESGKNNKKEIVLVDNNKEYKGTSAEATVLDLLFDTVGNNGRCNLKELRKFGNTEINARKLTKKIDYFKKQAKEESESKEYFKKSIKKVFKVIYIIMMCTIILLLTGNVFLGTKDNTFDIIVYIFGDLLISILLLGSIFKFKNRTENGAIEYSKWLAHKRFLKDFSKFDEKELPEIELWEKYMVTATILGCANKVRKAMQLKIANINDYNSDYLTDMYLINSMNRDLTRTINSAVNSSINTANYTISAAESSSSSSGGFGGGSSFGGGRRWTEAAVEVVSKRKV